MKIFDVAIVGSGPAGASAAYKLAENNLSVVIIEKESLPRYKTCGGGFAYRGRREMPFDVSETVEREFYKLDVFFGNEETHFTPERDKPIVSMVMRDKFDNLLVTKAKEKGAEVYENHKLTGMSFNEHITLHTSGGDITSKFVIAADGALSPTAKHTGWKETRYLIPALEYEVEVLPEDFERLSKQIRLDFDAVPLGYGWSFPKKNHLSIGIASARRKKINLKKYYREYLETLGIKEIVSESFHGFQIPLTTRKDGFVKKNVFLTGDAAGFADPLSAEGISNAITSGYFAAESIIESELNSEKAALLYEEKLQESFLPELKVGVFLSKLFYENKRMRNLLIKKYGVRICEVMTDVLMGDRNYPLDIKQQLKKKFKKMLFQ